jgi:hypothetical protein
VTSTQRMVRRRRIGVVARRAAARSYGRRHEPVFLEPEEFARRLVELGVRTHVGFDDAGNLQEVEVDPAIFAAEVARFDQHPHDSDELDDGDDDCPICRALRVAAIGPPNRRWSMD